MRKSGLLITLLFVLVGLGYAQDLHSLAKDLPCLNRNFNVYVYVAQDRNGLTNYDVSEIQEALDTTNKFFAPICLTFSLCKYDSIVNYQFDNLTSIPSTGAMLEQYPEQHRIVIYIAQRTEDPYTCGLAGTGGFIELKKGCSPTALAHEMGHYFGLLHTCTGSGEENVDGSNCETAGDQICDTPADPYNLQLVIQGLEIYHKGCTFIWPKLDANGQFYQPDMGNIMSYYACKCGFTRGQYLKMVETYHDLINTRW